MPLFLDRHHVIWLVLNGLDIDPAYSIEGALAQKPVRKLFSREGTIKVHPALMEIRLRLVLRKYGGWDNIMRTDYEPTEELYGDLQALDFSRAEFEKLREYVANPGM